MHILSFIIINLKYYDFFLLTGIQVELNFLTKMEFQLNQCNSYIYKLKKMLIYILYYYFFGTKSSNNSIYIKYLLFKKKY